MVKQKVNKKKNDKISNEILLTMSYEELDYLVNRKGKLFPSDKNHLTSLNLIKNKQNKLTKIGNEVRKKARDNIIIETIEQNLG